MDAENLHFVPLRRPYTFSTPVPGREFAAWIVASDPDLTNDERNVIAAQIVAAGCRYAVCSGIDCSGWDDAVDWAYLARCPDWQPRDEDDVMTSWHEKQTAEDVAHFFVWCTRFDDWEAKELVVVSVGDATEGRDALVCATKALADRVHREHS